MDEDVAIAETGTVDEPSSLLPGLALTVAIAVVATLVGRVWPVAGSAVPAVLLGALIATLAPGLARPGGRLTPGTAFAGREVLQSAVVVLGLRLSLAEVVRVGASSLPVMVGTLVVCLLVARLAGRRLGVDRDLQALVGCGTGICGASAIAAIAPVIGAATTDIAYAVSTIFVFNIAAVLVFPVIGHALGLSQNAFGLFAGTAVNDTSSVVAAATTYGAQAANHAIVVKLVRTLMIIPIVLTLAVLTQRRHARAQGGVAIRLTPWRLVRLVPWFLVGFLAAALVDTLGWVPASAGGHIGDLATFLVSVALAGIGLSTDIAALRRTGHRPLLLGALLWVTVTVTSLGLQAVTGR